MVSRSLFWITRPVFSDKLHDLKMLNCYLVHFVAGFFVVSGLVRFCWRHKHLLVTLLRLEYIILILFVLLVFRGR